MPGALPGNPGSHPAASSKSHSHSLTHSRDLPQWLLGHAAGWFPGLLSRIPCIWASNCCCGPSCLSAGADTAAGTSRGASRTCTALLVSGNKRLPKGRGMGSYQLGAWVAPCVCSGIASGLSQFALCLSVTTEGSCKGQACPRSGHQFLILSQDCAPQYWHPCDDEMCFLCSVCCSVRRLQRRA